MLGRLRPTAARTPRAIPRLFLDTSQDVFARQLPVPREHFQFLQKQWLVSPDTTGWHGGVHSPVRVVQKYMMAAARLTSKRSLARDNHYVTILREPVTRFLSEFYESFDGWEAAYGMNTMPVAEGRCSALLPPELRNISTNIDETSKNEYDRLFDSWVHCPFNQAADRQTRSLSFNPESPSLWKQRNSSRRDFLEDLCAALPPRDPAGECAHLVARHTLVQLSYFAINEERCASEKLFEAQFGLRFSAKQSTHEGKDAHKVPGLRMDALTRAQQQRVRWLNRYDLLLYAEARAIFQKRLRSYGIPNDVNCT
eukprot:CAMPEP_0119378666 /NCGR_PEP_ID=MMETSP1334-20130426/49299_1 /TAXON_ID=127549 /ORGANISM="Calcidiscus leptoporus, Strain RCC1130" /LENGTH=310 /DNA_ID=CAMNT_0007397949 /DNA_START=78 /DNA_END=1010 /DNA_ORIENTATION=-